MSRTPFFVAGAFLLAAVPLTADAQLAKVGTSEVAFTALGPAGMSIHGTTSELNVADGPESIVVTVPVKTFVTGIGLRDKHVRDDLEADKYPTAELSVARSALKFPGPGQEANTDGTGTLKLHGQSRSVKFHYVATRDGSTYAVKGKAQINMGDFGVHPPSYLGITVKPDVSIEVKFNVVDK
jgi:polyisoprenoid-binding protein YceI